MLSLNPLHYVILGLTVSIAFLYYQIYSLEGDIDILKSEKKAIISKCISDKEKLTTRLVIAKTNTLTIQSSLNKVQAQVKLNKIDADRKHKEFLAKTKKEVVDSYMAGIIKGVTNEKSECENIYSIIDNI